MPGMEKRAHLPIPLDADMLLAEMDRAGVDRAYLVPPSLDGDRNDLCLAAAARHPDRFRVMGRLLLDKPGARDKLHAMMREPYMTGVRLTFHRDNDRPLITNGAADWFWPEAERLGVPVMLHAPDRLPQVGEIAARHPRLTLIVDHMGLSRELMDGRAEDAADRLVPLARYPNLHVKVSALPCNSTEPYPFRNLHRALKRVIDAFGARRCFWGSDFSRLPASCSYRQAVTMFTGALDFLSADDLDWIMGRGICELLNWKMPEGT
jgi:predicted TIM-barrel fold metal-dependent hydrolase